MRERKVLFTQTCDVCKELIFIVIDPDYDRGSGPVAIKAEDAEMCDTGQDECCFKDYHKHCFDKHSCPVHPPKTD